MKNRFVLLLGFVMLFGGQLLGQVKVEKCVFLWDVTGSMKQKNLWDPCKDLLRKKVKSIQDKSTEVIILPFQDDVLEVKRYSLNKENAIKDLISYIDAFDISAPYKHGTNICRALEKAQDIIKKENINIVYLLTDGRQEVYPTKRELKAQYPSSCLQDFICEKWCPYAKEFNCHLIYYQLSSEIGQFSLTTCDDQSKLCRIDTVAPGPEGPIPMIYKITPTITSLRKDKSFFEKSVLSIPVSTDVPIDLWQQCQISASFLDKGSRSIVNNLHGKFNGSEILIDLSPPVLSKLKTFCDNASDYCFIDILFKVKPSSAFKVNIAPNQVQCKIKIVPERWVEIKVLN